MDSSCPTPTPSHIAWIDWLRFVAALMVVVGHTRFQHFGFYEDLSIPGKGLWSEVVFLIPRFANEAVTVFFVLSGFLVGGRCIERVVAGSFDARAYLIDRSSRIWLPLVPTVLVTWAVTALRGEEVPVMEGLGNLLSVQGVFVEPLTNNTSLWSLSYEIWFYGLALGVALAVAGGNRRARVTGLVVGVVSLAMFTKLQASYLFVWLAGALGYFLDRRRGQWGLLLAGSAVAALGAVGSAFTVEVRSLGLPGFVRFLPPREISLMALGLGMALLLPALAGFRPVRPGPVRIEAVGLALAAWSYSLYLIHRPVLKLWGHFEGGDQLYRNLNGFSCLMYAVKVASCLLAGWLFYLAFEKQTGRLRAKLKQNNRGKGRIPRERKTTP